MMVDVVDVDVVCGVSSAGCRHVSADAALDSAALSTCCDTVADTDEGAFCSLRAPTVRSPELVALQIRMNISEIYSMFTEIVFCSYYTFQNFWLYTVNTSSDVNQQICFITSKWMQIKKNKTTTMQTSWLVMMLRKQLCQRINFF